MLFILLIIILQQHRQLYFAAGSSKNSKRGGLLCNPTLQREREREREKERERERERERGGGIVHSLGTDHDVLSRRSYLQSSIKVTSMAANGKTYLLQFIFSWNGALCQLDQIVLVFLPLHTETKRSHKTDQTVTQHFTFRPCTGNDCCPIRMAEMMMVG